MNYTNFLSRSSALSFVISLLFILTGSQLLRAQGSWEPVGTAGFSTGTAQYISLALDGSGTPYVAYRDQLNGGYATVMKFDGNSWVPVGNPGFSAGPAQFVSLALDGSTPYVAYTDVGNSGKATVMKFDGANWVTVGPAGFSTGTAQYIGLALDGSTPYVAYSDGVNSGKATVMKFDDINGWVTVGSAGFSVSIAYYISLALDGSTPYVAYRDVGNGNKATVMKFDGSSWVIVGTAAFSAYHIETSLALDGSGTPYVALQEYTSTYNATVWKFDGSSWVTVGTAGFSAGQSAGPYAGISLALNGSTPYVAYSDAANSNKATVMKFDGTSWVTVGTAGFSAGAATFPGLALDGSGSPYVAYADAANSNKATVMKFVTDQPPVTEFDVFIVEELKIEVNSFNIEGNFTLESGSNGIDPLTEDVTLEVGAFAVTIPAGAFELSKKGKFEFEGDVDGVGVKFEIHPLGDNDYYYEVDVEGVDLSGTAFPVDVTLVIGDESGTASFGGELAKAGLSHLASGLPGDFALAQNYPNPFNPVTSIRFSLPEAAQVNLTVYDINGQLVRTLVSGSVDAGYHSVQWNGVNENGAKVASGVYLYRITAGGFVQVKKMILMK